uniref:Uncharacterized protein n=1 Tax=Solanum tuberosum TaxID=4113 RepID=M1BF89_SOLTU
MEISTPRRTRRCTSALLRQKERPTARAGIVRVWYCCLFQFLGFVLDSFAKEKMRRRGRVGFAAYWFVSGFLRVSGEEEEYRVRYTHM